MASLLVGGGASYLSVFKPIFLAPARTPSKIF